jgi:hypothetical protein
VGWLGRSLLALSGPVPAGPETAGAPGREAIEGDLKAALQRLAALPGARGADSPLAEAAEGALARIRTGQLLAVAGAGDQPLRSWAFEVPVLGPAGPEPVTLRIERDDEREQSPARRASPTWTVTVRVSLPDSGSLTARITLRTPGDSPAGGDALVSVYLWAERPDAERMFQENLDALRARLEKRGLAVDALRLATGPPPDDEADALRLPGGLLDETS